MGSGVALVRCVISCKANEPVCCACCKLRGKQSWYDTAVSMPGKYGI